MADDGVTRPGGHFGKAAGALRACGLVTVLLPGWTGLSAVAAAPAATTRAAAAAALAQPARLATPIQQQIDSQNSHWPAAQREALHRLYQPGGYQPLWFDAAGQPSDDAREALAVLERAAEEGLDPADYDAALRRREPNAPAVNSPGATASRDLDLSLSMLRYLRHLHTGRVDPRAMGFRLPRRDAEHDLAEFLRGAIAQRRVREAAQEMAPPLAQYRALRAALGRYRSLAAGPSLPELPTTATVRPGQPYAHRPTLQRRLQAFGDLAVAPAEAMDLARLDDALVAAVRRFQARHGLEADGILGRTTQTALNVPVAIRMRQIELAMERVRWLPHVDERPFVTINIPMFQLWASPAPSAGVAPPLGMGVIVGKALKTRTPVFAGEMRQLIFRPYWNVPRSILRNELLPQIERDPQYLQRQDMEIVRGAGDDATAVAPSPENLSLLGQGLLRLRQRPGPRNSLGLVKFVLPNDENIYLHGTPAQQLFSRSRRDFSHGCVRVEDPVGLAEWALQDQPQWTRERILAAMQGEASRRVDLARPIPVILYYVTAAVLPPHGEVHFADDLYGHDLTLERALARARTP